MLEMKIVTSITLIVSIGICVASMTRLWVDTKARKVRNHVRDLEDQINTLRDAVLDLQRETRELRRQVAEGSEYLGQ